MLSPTRSPEALHTRRLLLRRWRAEDLELFSRMNADPEVMRYFPSPLTYQETEALCIRIAEAWQERGYGLWAVEPKSTGRFIGFIGLSVPRFEAHFTPCVEIGWRLAKEHWGQGLAPEGASEVLRDAFERVGLDELVSMTTSTNTPSRRVMEKIGMHRNPDDDFAHPLIDKGHRLRPHVLYRLTKRDWQLINPPA